MDFKLFPKNVLCLISGRPLENAQFETQNALDCSGTRVSKFSDVLLSQRAATSFASLHVTRSLEDWTPTSKSISGDKSHQYQHSVVVLI